MAVPSWLRTGAPTLLLAALFVQVAGALPLLTATSDETSHLPAGYTYLTTGDLRLNPQHPPLVKMLCAAPLLALRPTLDLDVPSWTNEPPDEWTFGKTFLYSNDADRLLFWGRIPVAVLSLVLGFFVYRWASEMLGSSAGLVALFLYCFSPNVIAHSRLVTMDLALACFSFVCLYFFWRWARRGYRPGDAAVAGLCLGLALASKFSAVILLPVLAVLAAAVAWSGRRSDDGPSAGRVAGAMAMMVLLAAAIVWAVYLFPRDPMFYWEGLMQVNRDHDPNRAYYLLGRFRVGGFWYYFLVAFLVKTPLPTLGALALAAAYRSGPPSSRPIDAAFLLVPVAFFVVVTSALADNLGVRYLLPVYPLLFVVGSRAWPLFARHRAWGIAGAVLVAWYAVSAARVFPDQLAYFNEAAGGPSRGYRVLDDSNIDWGQDLKRLKRYLDDHGVERVRLLYPWNGDPYYYGILHDRVTPEDWYRKPAPGTYVVATVWLVRGLHEAETRGVPTDWLDRYEPDDRVAYSFFVYRFDD